MFVVTKEHTFWWPVKVRQPDPDKAGAIREETFKMRFKALPKDRGDEVNTILAELPAVDQAIGFITEVALDWGDVVDSDKNAVAFSKEALTDALLYPWVRQGILDAYTAAISGQAARLGN
ncbi:hypothetical protein [Labrys sp. WJW]|uniref:hypothetical protein n=1 Tax=Labrys sp. WJW TaxID=1737983 RepID=UPI00138FFBEC|nr:hypothetical protein [Labrys sp. WJW]